MAANLVPLGKPANDAERKALAYLRDHLPDEYTLLHNFEILREGNAYEIDVAILTPHSVFLVDLKGTGGTTTVQGRKWYPSGRPGFISPLPKLRENAKVVKSMLQEKYPTRGDIGKIYVDAVVVLTAPDAQLIDPDQRDAPDVFRLDQAPALFQSASRINGDRFNKAIRPLLPMVYQALVGSAKGSLTAKQFGNYTVVEQISSTDAYTEYRAYNTLAGNTNNTARLRVYRADPYLATDERKHQRERIANAYQALMRLPIHPNIMGARDFFPGEDEDYYVLVLDDLPGQALRQHIDSPQLTLTLGQRLQVAIDLLVGLSHAHKHGVVHRNLHPGALFLGRDNRLRVADFEYARAGSDRSRTIAGEIIDDLEPAYSAPEVANDPAAASVASDIFSAGLVIYELLTGERPFHSATDMAELKGIFPEAASERRSELPMTLDGWLQRLCAWEATERPTAADALKHLRELVKTLPNRRAVPTSPRAVSYEQLEPGATLGRKYRVEQRLGKGSFGVVYKVIDTFGDVARAVKIILRDRRSTLDRLKQEYRTLVDLPEHPNVVRVIDADLLSDDTPMIVFEFVDGLDLHEMINDEATTPEDAFTLAKDVAAGLVHLHRHQKYHCDIKPSNLMWTNRGVKVIDFNVAVSGDELHHGGGSRPYLPPDLDPEEIPSHESLADRDLYALGITIYETLTHRYPWDSPQPPLATPAPDPRTLPGLDDLAPELINILLRLLAPRRSERFASARDLLDALQGIRLVRRLRPSTTEQLVQAKKAWQTLVDGPIAPNTNPFVTHLLTLYSQSRRSNAGTRGLDQMAEQTYVETALDLELAPAVLAGEFGLVIITGNAGDGKTAFLQQLEQGAQGQGAKLERALNGCRFNVQERNYLLNYDGSQDEGDKSNDAVLLDFFGPFAGENATTWPTDETRLIAINEGRLVDFLLSYAQQFPQLRRVVDAGLATGASTGKVAVVNLNLRSVVAANGHHHGSKGETEGSILQRQLQRMVAPHLWQPCHACDLKAKCYVFHNAQSFQDEAAGARLIERLQTLYTLTHLRGRLHITLRDLRSALAYTLAGTRNCVEIHDLYANEASSHTDEAREAILQGFYFNSWMGGDTPNADRLLTQLKAVDMGRTPDPQLDRELAFLPPGEELTRFSFTERGDYDQAILEKLFADLPRGYSGMGDANRVAAYQRYMAVARRRYFFERRDEGWRTMLPYRTGAMMLTLVKDKVQAAATRADLIRAINRGEGLYDPERLGGGLALEVRRVDKGTIRSYRVFPADRFSVEIHDASREARFVEHTPRGLVLRYAGATKAELYLNLDVYEMLQRLNNGYRPSLEEEQGYYLSLSVFKNRLGSERYDEVLLTMTGHDFYRIQRRENGALVMDRLEGAMS